MGSNKLVNVIFDNFEALVLFSLKIKVILMSSLKTTFTCKSNSLQEKIDMQCRCLWEINDVKNFKLSILRMTMIY